MTVPKGLPKRQATQVPMPSTIIDSRTGKGSLYRRERVVGKSDKGSGLDFGEKLTRLPLQTQDT
jgi:hypothetical protein